MSDVVVRIQDVSRHNYRLSKLLGTVSLPNLVDLLYAVDLDANPRMSKVGKVTEDIEESMEKEPEIFHFMSKGILIAASEIKELDRSRFRLTFQDKELEGILDGGHNSFSAGRTIVKAAVEAAEGQDAAEKVLKSIRGWPQLKEALHKYEQLIKEHKAKIPELLMPVEVISPSDDPDGYEYFNQKVFAINAARNNNAELTTETRSNKMGYYEEIKANLDPVLVDAVEWKSNDGGRIKVRDLVALALIALSKLGRPTTDLVTKTPAQIFSSKSWCVKTYNKLMDEPDVTSALKGEIVEIVDPGVKSALTLMRDLPRLLDLIYTIMPAAYNKVPGKFGKIKGVFTGNHKTPFYRKPCEYSYGEGFIYPIIYGLTSLMKYEGDTVEWIVKPDEFVEEHLPKIMKSFHSMMTAFNFDPAKLGKAPGAYELGSNLFLAAYNEDLLKRQSEG